MESTSSTSHSSIHRLKIAGSRLVATSARSLIADAAEAFAAGATAVVIDLDKVGFVDSLGVASLATILRRAPSGTRVVLAGMTPYVQTVARVTHLHEVFAIYATAEAAMAALSK